MAVDGRLTLQTAPAVEPVSVDDMAEHLKLTSRDEDAFLTGLIVAAREHAETVTRRALCTQTWDWNLDCWPACAVFEVPLPPLASVSSIKYYDTSAVQQTWATSNYQVSTYAGAMAEPGRISYAAGVATPALQVERRDPVTIRFVAGYGVAAAVPQPIRTAIKFLVAEMWTRRTLVTVGTIQSANQLAADQLLAPYRVLRF